MAQDNSTLVHSSINSILSVHHMCETEPSLTMLDLLNITNYDIKAVSLSLSLSRHHSLSANDAVPHNLAFISMLVFTLHIHF
jgi:hypothetical protein